MTKKISMQIGITCNQNHGESGIMHIPSKTILNYFAFNELI